MDRSLFVSNIIDERSQLSYVKREIHSLIRPNFGESRTGEIDIVVAEMLSNILKYAGSGELLFRLSKDDHNPVFELICIDNGPGIKDVSHSLKDGVSTRNTLGHGLGAIARLSTFSQIYSQVGWGTIVYSKFATPGNKPLPPAKLVVACLNVAMPGEKVSGDGVAVRFADDKAMFFAADGLGHGPHAKEAVDKAFDVFYKSISCDPTILIQETHNSVKKSRGLVGTIAVLDVASKQWEICGIGNIHTRLQKGLEYKNYICHNGIISLNIPGRLENAVWPMEKFQLMIFCSDGIKTRWDLVKYPSILKYDPMIIAAAIYKDHARRTDDMTVLIVKVA